MEDTNDIIVAIDLGSESVKAAFVYSDNNDDLCYGKLEPLPPNDAPFPSLAYYDEIKETWSFGEEVYNGRSKSFKNIVKIKELLSHLIPKKTDSNFVDDANYYFSGYDFPKFYFPKKNNKNKTSFSEMIYKDMTFKSIYTPQEVCEQFFTEYFTQYLNPVLERLLRSKKIQNANIKYVALYPSKAKSEYINEIKRLIEFASCVDVSKAVSSTKAVGLFAYHEGYLDNQSHALVVDIGETDLSVAKIETHGAAVTVDGADAHNEPIEYGGTAYDELVRKIVESKVSNREILGRGNGGSEVSFVESGTHYQQFLLMNNIKSVKSMLSLPDGLYLHLFKKGVPINAERDVIVETRINRGEFLNGIDDCNNIVVSGANKGNEAVSIKIADYIISELKRSNNNMVTDVILSGGAAQTYGLSAIIAKKIAKEILRKVRVISFNKKNDTSYIDSFSIPTSKLMVYASAIGGAILGTNKYVFQTVAALSYGTWALRVGSTLKELSIILKKGTVISEEGGSYWKKFTAGTLCTYIKGDEIFSTFATKPIPVGEPNSVWRKVAIRDYGLKVISGEKGDAKIRFARRSYNGALEPVYVPYNFTFLEGIVIDGEGRAAASVINVDSRFEYKDVIVYIEGLDEFGIKSIAREKE